MNVCCATPIYQEAWLSIVKQVKSGLKCLSDSPHFYPTWMATAPSNRPIKMVVHIQHLQCLSKDDSQTTKPIQQLGDSNVQQFPSEKKTNRQGTAPKRTTTACIENIQEKNNVQNDVRRLAECGRKIWLQVQNVRAKMIGHCAEDNFPTFKVSSVANPKNKIKKEVQKSSWNGLGQPQKLW